MNLKKLQRFPLGILLAVFTVSAMMVSCNDGVNIDDFVGVHAGDPFDPSKAVEITSFTPESGGVGQQLVLSGSNFGNDTSLVNVTIGGKKAVVVSVKNDALYCYVPSKAFKGDIVVTIGNEKIGTQTATASKNFNYERKMVVGRLCGTKNERDDQGWKDGSFETVTGFRNDGVMRFSPYNHDQLFVVYDQEPNYGTVAHGIQLIDLKQRTVQTILPLSMFNSERLRTIDFAVDPFAYDETGLLLGRADDNWFSTATANEKRWREHLIIAADNADNNHRAHAVYIVDRDSKGEFSSNSPHRLLASYQQCNGASMHPNGELYFTSFEKGEVCRLDMEKYWESVEAGTEWDPNLIDNVYDSETGTTTGSGAFERLFTVGDNNWEFQVDIHPSGKYAYIVVINRNYMLRTDYNESTKRFSPPYIIAGDKNANGLVDGVGQSARMLRPYQGTFVKNEEYVKEGRSDVYDFYFCDSQNNAIRSLSPEGIVKTYAGGNAAAHSDNKTAGSENGELRDVARFSRPTGLVNDVHKDKISGENTLIFYILDTMNRSIRTITMEEEEEADGTGGTPAPVKELNISLSQNNGTK